VANVRFEVADPYQLPFPDHSFDAAFAHAVLTHLREPVRALVEMRRTLRPGGIVGVSDWDFGAFLVSPVTPTFAHRPVTSAGRRYRVSGAALLDHDAWNDRFIVPFVEMVGRVPLRSSALPPRLEAPDARGVSLNHPPDLYGERHLWVLDSSGSC
jgi:SAM-dependent methyltransferase